MTHRAARAGLVCLLGLGVILTSVSALAFNWTQAHPGVRHVQQMQAGPVRVNAVEVNLCAPGVSLRATRSGEGRRTTSSFGQLMNAQVAINGDFYNGSYQPIGLAIGASQRWPNNADRSGHGFIAFGPQQAQISPTNAVVSDPPAWMHDTVGGNILVLTAGAVTNDAGSFCTTRHPRTAAGLSADGNMLYLAVVDGRTTSSRGMTCTELGQLMKDLGAHTAINLDGGGSTTMWIQGQGVTNVPSDGSQRTVANHLAVHATGSGAAKSCNQFDVDIDVNFLGLSNPLVDGDSANIPDVFPGDELQAEILIQNRSSGVIRGVQAGYWIENPYIKATNYAIYTDHPHYDRQTWQLNSADSAPENPARDAMGGEGALTMHAFSPNETKRVVIDLEATRYSVGFSDHPDVRAWIRNIENVYGVQDTFFGEPTNANHVGRILRAYDQLDVLSTNEWQFRGRVAEQLEGWRKCDGESVGLFLDTGAHALRVNDATSDLCLLTPSWASIDADVYDELVLKLPPPSQAIRTALYWAGDGQEFSTDRSVAFERGPGEDTAFVVPLGDHPAWQGTVTKLQILPVDGADGALTVALQAVFFQSSGSRATGSETETYLDTPPVTLIDDSVVPDPDPDLDAGYLPDASGGDAGGFEPPDAGAGQGEQVDSGRSDAAGPGGSTVSTGSSSCQVTDSPLAPGPTAMMLMLVIGLVVRRKRHTML